jgi:hypothetical protein
MTSDHDVTAPCALLDAIDAAERQAPLPPAVAKIVASALASPSWASLTAASRSLRALERFAGEDGRPVPPSVTQALASIRAAIRALRGDR